MNKKDKNLYDILQISETASPEIIRAAYESLIAKYDPDKNEAFKEQAEQYIAEINDAYSVLSDPAKRQEYDSNLLHRVLRPRSPKKALIAAGSTGCVVLLFAVGFLFFQKQPDVVEEPIAENIILDPIDDLTEDDIALVDNALINDSFMAQLRENELSSYTTKSLSYDDLKYMVWISKDGSSFHTVSSCLSNKESVTPYLVSISMAISSGYAPCADCFSINDSFKGSNLALQRWNERKKELEAQEKRRKQRQEKASESTK